MKKKMFLLTCLLSPFLAVLSSCNELPADTLPEDQGVYFEVTYANFAWGKQYKGFLIGKNGEIRTYDDPALLDKREGDKPAKAQLEERFSQSKTSAVKADIAQLNSFIAKIPGLKDSNYSQPQNVGADMGGTDYIAYQYDSKSQTYKRILLKQTGDVQVTNQDPNAKATADWLVTISKEIYK